jgi:hypothetical protein
MRQTPFRRYVLHICATSRHVAQEAPGRTCAVAALAIVLIIRPVLRLTGVAKMFSDALIAEFSFYVTVLGLLILCI